MTDFSTSTLRMSNQTHVDRAHPYNSDDTLQHAHCGPEAIPPPCNKRPQTPLHATMAVAQSYTTTTISPHKRQRTLMPALPRTVTASPQPVRPKTTFYSLPAELRIAIYRLILQDTQIHILAAHYAVYTRRNFQLPHALVRTSHQVRNEVLPIIHAECPIRTTVEDLNFDGLLSWMSRMPPDQEANLCKNKRLRIMLDTTRHAEVKEPSATIKNAPSLRKWLHIRADAHRPQPGWVYVHGVGTPDSKTACHLRRRAKRSNNPREQKELYTMLAALRVTLPSDVKIHMDGRSYSAGIIGSDQLQFYSDWSDDTA